MRYQNQPVVPPPPANLQGQLNLLVGLQHARRLLQGLPDGKLKQSIEEQIQLSIESPGELYAMRTEITQLTRINKDQTLLITDLEQKLKFYDDRWSDEDDVPAKITESNMGGQPWIRILIGFTMGCGFMYGIFNS
jgi:hypothetical protein